MPGATSFFATRDILGSDLSGQVVVVTGAAGAVGSAVAQLAKLFGCKLAVGFAGSDDKCALCRERYGYDVMINYKTADVAGDLAAAIGSSKQGVHAFFDNTGGSVAKVVKEHMVDGGKVAKVGQIAGDDGCGENGTNEDARLDVKGFYAGGIFEKWSEAVKSMAGYISAGSMKYDETVQHGIQSFPKAMIDMMEGKNTGKMVVKL